MKKLTGAALALMMLFGGTPIWAQTDDSSTSTDIDKSPTKNDLVENGANGRGEKVVDENGNGSVTLLFKGMVSDKTYEELTQPDAVKNIIDKAGYDVPKNANVVLLGMGNYSAYEQKVVNNAWPGMFGSKPTELPEGGMDFEFNVWPEHQDAWQGLKAGDSIYVMHQLKNGAWEVMEATLEECEGEEDMGGEKGLKFKLHLDSLSPIAFVKVMSDGTVVKLEKEEVEQTGTTLKPGSSSAVKNTSTTKRQVSVKKSPNTGF